MNISVLPSLPRITEDVKFKPIRVADSYQYGRWLDKVQPRSDGDHAEPNMFCGPSVQILAKALYDALVDEFCRPEFRKASKTASGVELPTLLRKSLVAPFCIYKMLVSMDILLHFLTY